MQHRERLKRIADLMRRGYTPEEIADSVQRPLRTVKDDMKELQALNVEHFRRERAKERAQTFEMCQRTQASLWKMIEERMKTEDHQGVPAAARALLQTIRTGESLRNADEKDVAEGRLTVRDIFEEMGPDYLDDPEPPRLGDGNDGADDAPQAED